MSKKLLNEAAVRRFMGLAGMKANTVSNAVNEIYGAKDEEIDEGKRDAVRSTKKQAKGETPAGEEDNPRYKPDVGPDAGMMEETDLEEIAHADEGHGEKEEGNCMEEMDVPEGEHEDPVEDELMGDAPEMEITSEEAEVLANVLQKLMAAKGDMAMDMDAEEEDELADDLEVEDAELDAEEDVPAMEKGEDHEDKEEYMMKEEEIVQEVARRVAARILKAKKAQKEMNEALGK
jgi:hypothetical protein